MTQAKFMTAVYPGTFDPMTLGHEDLMRRASRLFDKLILAVAAGHHKRTMFTIAERLEIAAEQFSDLGREHHRWRRRRFEEGVVEWQLAHLLRCRFNQLIAAIADIHAVKPGEGIEAAAAVAIDPASGASTPIPLDAGGATSRQGVFYGAGSTTVAPTR